MRYGKLSCKHGVSFVLLASSNGDCVDIDCRFCNLHHNHNIGSTDAMAGCSWRTLAGHMNAFMSAV